MSCDIYTGTPGSGKSLDVANKVISAIKHGKNVIANFPIDRSYFVDKKTGRIPAKYGTFYYVDNQYLTVDFLKKFAVKFHRPRHEGETLLVIDECGCMFNCRIQDVWRREWCWFFTQHRKLGFNVILVSQFARKMIDNQILGCVETEYKHRALKQYNLFGILLSLLCGGLFYCNIVWFQCGLKTGNYMFRLNKKKANIYDSYRLFEGGEK